MTLGPRVFLSRAGLERTDLMDVRNRVRYTSLYALARDPDAEELKRVVADLERALGRPDYLAIRPHTEAQRGVRRSLEWVEQYMGLVALLSLLLGGIGVSQIVRAWLAGRTRSVAILRCLGFRAREIAITYLGHVVLLTVAGCLVGALLGAALPWLVQALAPELFRGGRAHLWQPLSLVRGIGLGLLVAPLFSLPPLTAVWRVPPAAVLRADAVPLAAPRRVRVGALIALFLGVLLSARIQADGWRVAGAFSGGLVVLTALLFAAARGTTALAARVPRGRLGPYLEHGLAALSRPASGTSAAIVALGLGVMVIVTMLLVERRLTEALTSALPEDAPSVFLVDIQPEQWDGVRAAMIDQGARAVDSVPVVMARLRAIDGRSSSELAEESRDEGRGAWRFTREQRLTWMDTLPADNEIVAGALWSDAQHAEVSLEREFAKDLGVGLGAALEFDVQGVPLELRVTSLRTVQWESFGINFFLIVEPGVLEEAPHFRLATGRFDSIADETSLQNELAATYPNVTLLRVRPILEKVAAVLARIALAVRSLGFFTILTGLVILAGSVGANALRRAREAALLKTLGVTRAGVTLLFAVEYALTGLVAGTIGAVGALALGWGFLEHVLELHSPPAWAALPSAAVAAALLSTLSGLAASTKALRARPMETLRG
jgi:putative ABC transport system permease protein